LFGNQLKFHIIHLCGRPSLTLPIKPHPAQNARIIFNYFTGAKMPLDGNYCLWQSGHAIEVAPWHGILGWIGSRRLITWTIRKQRGESLLAGSRSNPRFSLAV
jgi:hypothetical protein